jgi:hypothetical protein
MNIVNVNPSDVENPRELVIRIPRSGPVAGVPGDANRLFIYTGIIKMNDIALDPDNIQRDKFVLNISQLHNRRFDGSPFLLVFYPDGAPLAAPVASLASIFGKDLDDAEDVIWAVDRTEVDEDNQELRLLVEVAVQGLGPALLRVSYQINVLVVDRRGE